MKLIVRMGLIVLLTLGIIKTNRFFLTKPVFQIKNITVTGASEKLEQSFLPLKNELMGKNINEINLSEIEKTIFQDVRVNKVSVTRNKIDEITINVEEKEPKYYLQYKKKIYLLDKDGKIYGYLNDLKTKDFPFIVVKAEEEIEIILGVLDKIEATDFKDVISQIYIDDSSCIKVVLYDGAVIKTDRDVKKEKYDIGSYLFFDLSGKKKIDYIDLRYEDYVVRYMEDKDGR